MNTQMQDRKSLQQRTLVTNIVMLVGILLLTSGVGGLIVTSTVRGVSGWLAVLSLPVVIIGLMLFLLGLVNKTKEPSLRWLRITVIIVCGILIALAFLYELLVLGFVLAGF